MKKRKRLLIVVSTTAMVLVLWLLRAHLVLACIPLLEEKGESGGQRLRDSLIFCGPSSIGPVIATIRDESPWRRNYCYLPDVLEHFGEPAHRQLLKAIDSETHNRHRAFLISALQRGFKDFTRFDRWLAAPDLTSSYELTFMAGDIRLAFPDAPPLSSESSDSINPEFLVW
ncbi:hypothetical protein, partial [Pedosphaera parvula]